MPLLAVFYSAGLISRGLYLNVNFHSWEEISLTGPNLCFKQVYCTESSCDENATVSLFSLKCTFFSSILWTNTNSHHVFFEDFETAVLEFALFGCLKTRFLHSNFDFRWSGFEIIYFVSGSSRNLMLTQYT